MKRILTAAAWYLMLSLLLTGCMGDARTEGPTINDMVMPTAGTVSVKDAGADAVQAMAGADSAAEATAAGADASGEEDTLAGAAFKACPALNNCRLDVSMELEETFKQGANAFVVPFRLQGTIKTVLNPLVKMGVEVSSVSSFASGEMKYAAKLYIEQTKKEWAAYSNETGKWVKTVQNAANAPAIKISKADWEAFAAAVKNAKPAGEEDVDGVRATKLEASVQAKLVYKLFGAQLCYVIPGMQAASEKDKASDKSVRVLIWISGGNELLQMQFDAGAAWEKVVKDSFAARSTDDFDISVENVGIIVTVTKLNSLEDFEIPQEVKTATATASPAATPETTPDNT